MTNIDSLVDKSLAKSKPAMEEPKHVLVHTNWFRTWKMFKYETPSQDEAYDKYNAVMEQLSQCNSAVVDVERSKVTMKDISPITCSYVKLKYVVEVYWRNA